MKYALQCMMRFGSAAERDRAYAFLAPLLQRQYPNDDCYLSKHKCYHDEPINKPCEPEGSWTPLPYHPVIDPE